MGQNKDKENRLIKKKEPKQIKTNKFKALIKLRKQFNLIKYIDNFIKHYMLLTCYPQLQINVKRHMFNKLILRILLEKKQSLINIMVDQFERHINVLIKKKFKTLETITGYDDIFVCNVTPVNIFINDKYKHLIGNIDVVEDRELLVELGITQEKLDFSIQEIYIELERLFKTIIEKRWRVYSTVINDINQLYDKITFNGLFDEIILNTQKEKEKC